MCSDLIFSTDSSEDEYEDAEENFEDAEENDDDDGNDTHVALGSQVSLRELLEMDQDDESLRRWKEQLLSGVDWSEVGENPDTQVTIQSLTIITSDRSDIVLPIPFNRNMRRFAFTLKLESHYRFKLSFTVSNNIVSGLRYTNIVWKRPQLLRVENKNVMLGSFSPQNEPYTYELEEDINPSSLNSLGEYIAEIMFVDDDDKCYLQMIYEFQIRDDLS